jgi:hypothetical protein
MTSTPATITAGATLKLTTGKTVKVNLVTADEAYIVRTDGKFPRAVSLAWLASKVKG